MGPAGRPEGRAERPAPCTPDALLHQCPSTLGHTEDQLRSQSAELPFSTHTSGGRDASALPWNTWSGAPDHLPHTWMLTADRGTAFLELLLLGENRMETQLLERGPRSSRGEAVGKPCPCPGARGRDPGRVLSMHGGPIWQGT